MGYKSYFRGEEIDDAIAVTSFRKLSESQREALEEALWNDNASLITEEDWDYFWRLGTGDLYARGWKLPYTIGTADENAIDFIWGIFPYVSGTNLIIDYTVTHLYKNSDGSVDGKRYLATHSLPAQVIPFPQGGGEAPA